jgi:crotonobetainyl-CoA:carnitine CoA-transferase CaiB-like acyl-CoA transferase
MPSPLHGYRIVELATMISAPNASVVLADQGAEVIKVEPIKGDLLRLVGRTRDDMSPIFVGYNRNKKSLAVDLKDPAGIDIVRKLLATADVLVQNFRPGVLERMGLGYADLKEQNPRLIYASISGFGPDGPYGHLPAYDAIIQGLSGMAYLQTTKDENGMPMPHLIASAVIDKLTGLYASQAITAALCDRERTGKGCHIHVSMIDVAVSFLWPDVMADQIFADTEAPRSEPGKGEWLYPTKDGYITALPHSDVQFAKVAKLVDRLDWLEDERFSSVEGRGRYFAALGQEMRKAFRGRTTAEWLELLDEADVAHGAVLPPAQVRENVQVLHNQTVIQREHPRIGNLRECRAPAIFDGEKQPLREPAPSIGEQTEALLAELGFDRDAIRRLTDEGTIA